MKVETKNNKKVIYLNKYDLLKYNFNKKNIENEFKKLLKNLKLNYNIKLVGYYNITIYKDVNYGLIIELVNDGIDYYSDDYVAMKIKRINKSFLYEIENFNLINKYNNWIEYIIIKDKVYIKIKKTMKYKDYINLIENSSLIYSKNY